MTDQQLRLVAGLKDNASPGIRRIGAELKRVRVEPGMAQAQKWVRGFNDDVGRFKKSSLTVANVLSSMGVGGLAAAGSIAGLASQFKALAERVLDVKELGREIGVTTDELRAMERAGQHFGFDPSKMEGALKRLAGLMPIFRRGGNNELTQALARSPELIAKIRGEADDTAAVFKDIMGYVGKLTNPQDRIKFYEQIFGDGDLEKLNAEGARGFQAQLEAARKSLEPYTQATIQQAQALRDAINDFNQAVENLELRAAPTVFKGMKQAADDFREAFDQLEKAAEWFVKAKNNPAGAAKDVADAAKEKAGEIYGRWHDPHYDDKREGNGEFAPAKDDADKAGRLAAMQAELDAVAARIAADKNPVGFPVREADAIARQRELRDAIATLRGDGPKEMPVRPETPWKAFVQPARPEDSNLGLPGVDQPSVQPPPAPVLRLPPVAAVSQPVQPPPAPVLRLPPVAAVSQPVQPPPAPVLRLPPVVAVSQPVQPPQVHVPSRYDAEVRARAAGRAQEHDLDGFVLGALEKPILHLHGTLRTAAAQAERDGIRPAAFHPGEFGAGASIDPVATIAAGTKEGVLAALRELQGALPADAATARDGIVPAAFHPGGGAGGGYGASAVGHPGASNMRYGHGAHTPGAGSSGDNGLGRFDAGAPGANGYGLINAPYRGALDKPGEGGMLSPKMLFDYLKNHGASDNEATMLTGAAGSESSFNPNAVHDHGNGYGLWGHNIHHRIDMRGMTWQQQADAALAEAKQKYADRINGAKTPDELADAEAHYEAPRGFTSRNPRGADNYTGRLNTLRRFAHGFGTMGFGPAAPEVAPMPPSAAAGPKGDYPGWMDGRSRREMAGINAPLARDLLAASQATGLHFRITQGLRTAEEAARNAVTGRGVFNSQHRWGAAADVVMQDAEGRDVRDRAAYKRFADAFTAHSRATGGHARWLGDLPGRWGSDIVHFDQGLGYGQTHARDPYGSGGPTAADIAASNKEIFSGPDNPFLRAGHDLRKAAEDQTRAAGTLGTAHRVLRWFERGSLKSPAWHNPGRPDLSVERRNLALRDQQGAAVRGGIDAHVHIHDGQVRSARVSSRGHVREAGITVRSAPQRTYTV